MVDTLKAIAIGGEPATGKTTLMRNIIKKLDCQKVIKYGLLRGHCSSDESTVVLGVYKDGDVFAGTDKLSMAVNPHFIKYAAVAKRNIIFEGDRLFTLSNLEMMKHLFQLKVIVLHNEKETLKMRHELRNDNQSEKFLKGRKTKLSNISANFSEKIDNFSLTSLEQSEQLADSLCNWLNEKQ